MATHSHSDHIGSGDEILEAFPTDRLYINEYSDRYVPDENRRWDNQYVYDDIIEAARRNGAEIITKSTHNRRERPVYGHRGGSRGRFYYRITTFEERPWDARDPH